MEKSQSEELNGNNDNIKSLTDSPEKQVIATDDIELCKANVDEICGDNGDTIHEESGKAHNNECLLNGKNNNHHVVPVGVLIVVFTVYLGMNTVLQHCFVNGSENETLDNLLKIPADIDGHLTFANSKNAQILERFLEYKDICKDLEIFTKDFNNQAEDEDEQSEEDDEENQLFSKEMEISSGIGSGSGSGSGDCVKPCKKTKKSKFNIKFPTNGKNGFHKHNKSSIKAKKHHIIKADKQELNLNKKNSTAEPIIYLFALVFIYLLLKAASDINQHYKSQNKNDKRLRRCSLQSYAQARPDRRASKELALKQKQQRLMTCPERRSISIELNYQQQKQLQQQSQFQHHHHHLVEISPQRQTPTPPTQPSLLVRPSATNNWQLLKQHMTQSVDNSDIPTVTSLKKEFPAMMNRRCSVPVAFTNYQRQTHTKSPYNHLGMVTETSLLNRRTSITMPLDPTLESMTTETKRRVRMINRH